MGMEGFKPAPQEKEPTIGTPENVEGQKELDDVLKVIREKIALAKEQLEKTNSLERTVGESGFAVEPKEAIQAQAKLKYLEEAHSLFFEPVLKSPTSKLSLEEALEGIESHTKALHDDYAMRFGKIGPDDVEEAKRNEAKKAMDRIKLRDKMVTEFSVAR